MAFLPRTIDRLLWPLGLAHGSSFVYFSPSLTRFPLAKRSTRDTILPLCHACHPAPDATFAPPYYTNNKSPWRPCPHRHMTWVHVAEPISNWEPCPNCPNCPNSNKA